MEPRTALGDATPDPDFRVLTFRPQKGRVSMRQYRKRASHGKSKSGCLTCKMRRVKCDEAKPHCLRCVQSHIQCAYTRNGSTNPTVSYAREPAKLPCAMGICPGVASLDCDSVTSNRQHSPYGIPDVALVRHFQHAFPDLCLLNGADVTPILALGVSHPFLLNVIMAVSASHLRCHTVHKQPSRIAEHFHQSLAITNFQSALTGSLNQGLADALILTCMFLSVLTFSVVEDDQPRNTWLFHDRDPERLGWFSVNLGLKPLLIATAAYREESILQSLYKASDDDQNTFYGVDKSLDRVPEHWMEFFGLNDDPSTNVFREPARLLAEIRALEPTRSSFFLYVNFIGALDLDYAFRDLLKQNDVRAIWLLGYWMGLMCRYEYWWIRLRARSEWRATCIWLSRRNALQRSDGESNMWLRLMQDLETAPAWGK